MGNRKRDAHLKLVLPQDHASMDLCSPARIARTAPAPATVLFAAPARGHLLVLPGDGICRGTTLIFGYGAWLVHQNAMSVGALGIFLDYVTRLYDPLNKLSTSGSGLISSMASVRRVFEVLDRDPHIKDRPDARSLPRGLRRLTLDHVAFSYGRDEELVLRDITATIEPGEMVAFVGASGVGKTTLLNLFPRFYDPTGGSIQLDGIDLRDLTLKSLRSHVALVLQESIVLPATIEENIAYGCLGAPHNDVRDAAERAGAAEFIEKLPRATRHWYRKAAAISPADSGSALASRALC